MPRHVFVVGLDDFNRRKLEALDAGGEYAFHPLLELDEVTSRPGYDVAGALEKAEGVLQAFPGTVDAVIGYWDFPVSLLIPLLCQRLGLRSPPFDGVLRCEHKYWSRLEQRRVAPDCVPRFQSLDPFDPRAAASLRIGYPAWIKPVKSFGSHLGFRLRKPADLERALEALRAGIPALGNAFNQFLARADLPPEVAAVDGNHCIVEGIVSGHQCTLEGFVAGGDVRIYGVVDSFRHPNRSSFTRYQYPSVLPARVTRRMADVAARVVGALGLDESPFNIEFFWSRREDAIRLLEINPRISQSHGDLFEKVDGTPHHRVPIDLALGRTPAWHPGAGRFGCAAKFFLRRFRDAVVTRVPTDEEIRRIEARHPGTLVEIPVREGMRLSELPAQEQDSYSYAYATVFMGARTRRELLRHERACEQALHFEFAE